MTDVQLLAFVIVPVAVLVGGWGVASKSFSPITFARGAISRPAVARSATVDG